MARRIGAGDYGPRSPLPSERVLEEEFSVHRATIRRALGMLSDQGLLTRTPGQRAYAKIPTDGVVNVGVLAGYKTEPSARLIILEGVKEAIASGGPGFSAFAAGATELSYFLDPTQSEEMQGLILLPPYPLELSPLREFRKRGAVVVIDRMIPGFEADFVGFQDFEAGYEAARRLYEAGHRRIGFLGSVVPETAGERCRGVEEFCQDAGIQPCANFSAVAAGRHVPEVYYRALFELGRQNWPTGAVCPNDETAAFMIAFLGRMGLKVPGDLALVGFGNAHTNLLNALSLSTMAQPYGELGRQSFGMITSRVQGTYQGEAREVRLPMEFVERGSCGSGTPIVAG